MKKLFLAALICLPFISCNKVDGIVDVAEGSPSVSINFVPQSLTKAFFGASSTSEAWESAISLLTVMVFDNGGNLVVQRNFSGGEVAAKSANFAIDNSLAATMCEFYAVANVEVPVSVGSKADLLAMLERDANVYNSTFAQVSSSAIRAGGFVMSGVTRKVVAAAGTKTDVAITLYRTVSKIAVQAQTTAEFANRYYGKVIVNRATISRSASQTNIIAPSTINGAVHSYSFIQASNGASNIYQNLFYVFENAPLAAGARLLLTLDATYDRDGDFATTTDQTAVVYELELTGDGGGAFNRNGHYKIGVNIDGLTGSDATATIVVAPWASPITQDVNVGQ